MTIRLLLADDHPLSLAGLAACLEQAKGVEVVARVENGIKAIALIKTLAPDVAVLDMTMPGASGLEVVLEARRWSGATRFAVVTGVGSPSVLQEIRRARVEGILLKTASAEEIRDGILRVAAGETVIAPAVEQILQAAEQANTLTAREVQVLQAIARGMTNHAASELLGISAKTIDTHRTNLMRKLGVRSTATLLVRAMRDGLIDVSDIE